MQKRLNYFLIFITVTYMLAQYINPERSFHILLVGITYFVSVIASEIVKEK